MQSDFENALDKIANVRHNLQGYAVAFRSLAQHDFADKLDNHIDQLEFAIDDLRRWRTAESDRLLKQAHESAGNILKATLSVTES